MLFSKFSQYLLKIEQTPSRLGMTAQLSELFSLLNKEEIPFAIYLSLGRLVPEYKSLEFQLSAKMVLRVLVQQMTQYPDIYGGELPVSNLFDETTDDLYEKKVNGMYKKIGDVGETAQQVFTKVFEKKEQNTLEKKKSDPSLTNNSKNKEILEVYEDLKKIAQDSGSGSQERKTTQLLQLLQTLDPVSIRFVSRIVVGKLRLGFSTMTIMDALSWSKVGSKADSKFLEELFQRKADLGILAQMYLKDSMSNEDLADKYQTTLGVPVVSALCQRLNSAGEIVEKMEKVIAEPKYDGLRVQIHVDKKTKSVRSFTRNLEETSHMFPELERAFIELDCESCILDGEVVGVKKGTGEILPFQETSTRRRKHGVSEKAAEIPVHFYVFDVLFKDGESFLNVSLEKRKKVLAKLTQKATIFIPTPFIVSTDAEELREFHEEQLSLGLEGAVMKKYDSLYKSGRKGWRWVKIKEVEGQQGKLNDTLDCVVMGYYRGRGKRAAFGLGAFLVGVINQKNGMIETVAKVGTGLTDAQFKEFMERTNPFIVENELEKPISEIKPSKYRVHKNLYPDVWVEPELVVEIAADEITKSQIHFAGKTGEDGKVVNKTGKALRFPRLVRFRDDKRVDQATTVKELSSITHLS